MSGPRDEIDAWLEHEVDLLPAPPGTFEHIRRQARRRKRRQAVLAAAGAVVIIAGIVAGPQVVAAFSHGPQQGQPAAAGRTASRSATARPAASGLVPTTGSATAPAQGTALSATTSGTLPPADFQPTSITMIGGGVGAVLGQAGTPGHCSGPVPADCTSLAGTSDWGTSWYGVSAPVTSGPDGALGVSQLRFLDLRYGWAFGPGLYVTGNGGRTWTAAQTYGLRVTGLEAAGNRAFAIFASCAGSGTDFAADCTSFRLYSAAAGASMFTPVPLPANYSELSAGPGAATHSAASLVIKSDAANPQGGAGYLLTPSGAIFSGPLTGVAWSLAGSGPCPAGAAQPSGQPAGTLLAAGPELLIVCGAASDAKTIWSSADGAHWTEIAAVPGAGAATSLAAAPGGQVLLATTAGIGYSPDGGKTWQQAAITGGTPSGGFSYLGMTTASQGVAVPARASLGEVFVTGDGGQAWTAHSISGS